MQLFKRQSPRLSKSNADRYSERQHLSYTRYHNALRSMVFRACVHVGAGDGERRRYSRHRNGQNWRRLCPGWPQEGGFWMEESCGWVAEAWLAALCSKEQGWMVQVIYRCNSEHQVRYCSWWWRAGVSGIRESPTSNYRRTPDSSPDSRHPLTGPCPLGAWVLSSLLSILCLICHILSTTSSRFVPGMGALLFLHNCYQSCKIVLFC